MKKFLAIVCLLFATAANSQGFSIIGGMTKFGGPPDGVYWNVGKDNARKLERPAIGLRWDSERLRWNTSFAVQYTYFGTATVNALAVTVDAPDPGGYLANTGGQCVGTCAPLARWVMKSRAQSIAFIGAKHFGDWSLEGGLNVYETKTSGRVIYQSGRVWNYKDQRYLGIDSMFGVGYRVSKNVMVRYQVWYLDGPCNTSVPEEAPAIFDSKTTQTITVGYTF